MVDSRNNSNLNHSLFTCVQPRGVMYTCRHVESQRRNPFSLDMTSNTESISVKRANKRVGQNYVASEFA